MKKYYDIPAIRVISIEYEPICEATKLPDSSGDNGDEPPRNDDDDVFTRKFMFDWD